MTQVVTAVALLVWLSWSLWSSVVEFSMVKVVVVLALWLLAAAALLAVSIGGSVHMVTGIFS